jgi:hypothetical protein
LMAGSLMSALIYLAACPIILYAQIALGKGNVIKLKLHH